MLREMRGSKKLLKLLLNVGAVCVLTLCAMLWLMSGSVLALVNQNRMLFEGAYLQEGNALNVTVSQTGCSPLSATKPAGQITLKVVNQTGEEALAVQLYGSRGELIREAYITAGATEWSESFDLPTGSYTLKAGHKTEWTCQITVQ